MTALEAPSTTPLSHPTAVHVAITRVVRKGQEQAFENAIHAFFNETEKTPGALGAYLLRPFEGSDANTYGIVRSFENEDAQQRFYASKVFQDWNEQISPLVEGPGHRHQLHGLEAFFRDDGPQPPPAWKMAVLTWVAVNPAVYLFASLGGFVMPPGIIQLLVVNIFVVASLTWGLMPMLTRVARPWLEPQRREVAR